MVLKPLGKEDDTGSFSGYFSFFTSMRDYIYIVMTIIILVLLFGGIRKIYNIFKNENTNTTINIELSAKRTSATAPPPYNSEKEVNIYKFS